MSFFSTPLQLALALSTAITLTGCTGTHDVAQTAFADTGTAYPLPQKQDDAINYPLDEKDDAINYPLDEPSNEADKEDKPNMHKKPSKDKDRAEQEEEESMRPRIVREADLEKTKGTKDADPLLELVSEIDDVPIVKDLKDEHLAMIDTAIIRDDNKIRVVFHTGDEKCFGQRPVVKETDDKVQIGIIEGDKTDGPEACTAVLRTTAQTIELKAPLGKRSVEFLSEKDALALDKQ